MSLWVWHYMCMCIVRLYPNAAFKKLEKKNNIHFSLSNIRHEPMRWFYFFLQIHVIWYEIWEFFHFENDFIVEQAKSIRHILHRNLVFRIFKWRNVIGEFGSIESSWWHTFEYIFCFPFWLMIRWIQGDFSWLISIRKSEIFIWIATISNIQWI